MTKSTNHMRTAGITLFALGSMIALAGLSMSGAVEYSDTLNIGLLNDKTNYVLLGGFMNIVGAIFFVGHATIFALRAEAEVALPPSSIDQEPK